MIFCSFATNYFIIKNLRNLRLVFLKLLGMYLARFFSFMLFKSVNSQ